MGQIRLYRKIYSVSVLPNLTGNSQTYTLFNPYSLSASTFLAGSGDTESNTIVEYNTPITQESTGIYYTDLNPILYATDITYDLVWYIQYTQISPTKKLTTRFRLNNQTGPSGEISIEIISNTLEIEIL
ncbi:MAG: hypothetical protein KatS3mg035_1104 [Bacteroidia bacterium]|nr:MAG: hypothetical protein KatS3mg035_1104 [Bacteroidia bacterium]